MISKEKNTHTAVNEKGKTEKSWTLFYKKLFYKIIQNDNNLSYDLFFHFASSFAAQVLLFEIRMTQEISEGESGNSK